MFCAKRRNDEKGIAKLIMTCYNKDTSTSFQNIVMCDG